MPAESVNAFAEMTANIVTKGLRRGGVEHDSKDLTAPTVVQVADLWKYPLKVGMRVSDEERACINEANMLPLANMMGDPLEAQFLGWLLRNQNGKKAIEVGVFRGSTTLTLAKSLPVGGKVVACDITEQYVLKDHWKGYEDKIDLRIAPATETIAKLIEAGEENTYDIAFIDADKAAYDTYYEGCLRLLRPGGIVALDNVLWHGRICDPEFQCPDTLALRALNEKVHKDERVDPIMISIADGLTIARKL